MSGIACFVKILMPIFFLTILSCSHISYTDNEKGKLTFEDIEYFAKQGDAKAQFLIADMYYNGEGVKQDYRMANEWATKAANQGDDKIQMNVATMYYKNGNYKNAAKWYEKSAMQGNVHSQSILAQMYFKGQGGMQNYKKSIEFATKAANQGHVVS